MHCSVYDEHSLEEFRNPKPKITKVCVEMYYGGTTVRLPPIITSFGNVPHYLVTLNSNQLMAIVGKYCQVFQDCRWIPHSELAFVRRCGAIAITMKNGIYVLGGEKNPTKSEFLPNGSNKWEQGPNIPDPGFSYGHGCMVSCEDFILTGGSAFIPDQSFRVIRYNIITKQWCRLDDLKVPRYNHRSVVFQGRLIISGGDRPFFDPDSKAFVGASSYVSTEIISLKDGTSSLGQPLLNARERFGMAVVNWNGVSKLIAFGDRNESNLDELLQCEEWDDQKLQWKPSSIKLTHGTTRFGYWAPNNHVFKSNFEIESKMYFGFTIFLSY